MQPLALAAPLKRHNAMKFRTAGCKMNKPSDQFAQRLAGLKRFEPLDLRPSITFLVGEECDDHRSPQCILGLEVVNNELVLGSGTFRNPPQTCSVESQR